MKRKTLALATLLCGTAICSPAIAQDALSAQETPTKPKAAEVTAAADTPDPTKSGEIIVTGDRREQSIQKYAGTAAVVSGEDLKKVGINSLFGMADSLPGVTVSNIDNQIEIYIRGIGTNNETELGDPAAATHFDNIYIPRTAGLGPAFFDVKQVEVNYGPQGTLRGRNATAGTVNVTSYPPKLGATEGQLGMGIGNYGSLEGSGFINLPVGDKVAFRLSGSFNGHDAYYKNVGPIQTTKAPQENLDSGVRAQMLFQPTQQLKILVAGDYNHQTGTGYFGTNFSQFLGIDGGLTNQANQIKDPRAVIMGPVSPFDQTTHYGVRGNIRWSGDGPISVEYNGSHRVLDRKNGGAGPIVPYYPGYLNDFNHPQTATQSAGPGAAAVFDTYSQYLSLSKSKSDYHELRFFNDTAPLVYSAGFNYFGEKQKTYLASVADDNPFFAGNEFNTRTKDKAYGIFADATYSVAPHFRLTAGIRYTDDKKSRTGVAARYGFALGGAKFECCGPVRLGTPGFAFNGFGRTIFNPDVNNDGNVTNQEIVNFYLNGIKSFGARDTFLSAFSNAIAQYPTNPGSVAGGPGCYYSTRLTYFQCAASGNYTYAVPFAGQIFQQKGALHSHFVDWRLRADADLGEGHLAYALVSRGHKSGGFNDNLGDLGYSPTYKPESVTLFEVGSKNRWDVGGHPLTLNGALFYNRYKNQQLSALLSVNQIISQLPPGVSQPPLRPDQGGNLVVSYTFNAATDATYGAQLSGSIVLPGHFKLGVDALYLRTKVLKSALVEDFRFQGDVNSTDAVLRSIQGNELPRTPHWQLNGSIAQAIPLNNKGVVFDWLVSAAYRSGSYQTIFNSVDYRFPSAPRAFLADRLSGFATFNAAAGITSGPYRFEVYANNFTNSTHAAALLISQFVNSRYYTNPRLIGARARVSF
jgi:iron complex outermembrane receptor protein